MDCGGESVPPILNPDPDFFFNQIFKPFGVQETVNRK